MILHEIENTLTTVNHKNSDVIEDMIHEIDEAMATIGITDEQEAHIREITQRCLARSTHVLEKAMTLKDSLHTARKTLESK